MHKFEGIANVLVTELQTVKHFLESEEKLVEKQVEEWRKHALLVPQ